MALVNETVGGTTTMRLKNLSRLKLMTIIIMGENGNEYACDVFTTKKHIIPGVYIRDIFVCVGKYMLLPTIIFNADK